MDPLRSDDAADGLWQLNPKGRLHGGADAILGRGML